MPGGRAGVLHRDGFTFDTGPTVLTMPDLITDAIRAATRDPSARPRRAASHAPARPGVPGLLRRRQHDQRALRPGGDARGDRPDLRQRGRRRLRLVRRLAAPALSSSRCRTSSTGTSTPRSACCPRLALLAQLVRLGAFGRLGAAVRRRFADPRLHRLFSFQAMYAGLAPESALALYAVITYMDSIEGVWFPEGGIHAVPMIMAQVAEKAGVTFRYGDAAEKVLRSPTGTGCGCPHGVWGPNRGRRCGLHS